MNSTDRFNAACEAAQSISDAAHDLGKLEVPDNIYNKLNELECLLLDFVKDLEEGMVRDPALTASERNQNLH